MRTNNRKQACEAPPGDPDPLVRTPEPYPHNGAKPNLSAARLTIDVSPELRGSIKVAACRRGITARGITAADILRDRLCGEFPDNSGGAA